MKQLTKTLVVSIGMLFLVACASPTAIPNLTGTSVTNAPSDKITVSVFTTPN